MPIGVKSMPLFTAPSACSVSSQTAWSVTCLSCLPASPFWQGGVGVSHAFVHIVDFDVPVEIFGMKVSPGDLIHADQHGALAIPDGLIDALPGAIDQLVASEELILGPARESERFGFKEFEQAWQRFESART